MLNFMVLSAPRSGSTWASNWLTTDTTVCLHDPILEHRPEDLDKLPPPRTRGLGFGQIGVACTALALLPDFVKAHPARKVILHRPPYEIDRSLSSIGLSPLTKRWEGLLEGLPGKHVHWTELFRRDSAEAIWDHLLPTLPFDGRRWDLLKAMRIDPNFDHIPIRADATKLFRQRIEEAVQ